MINFGPAMDAFPVTNRVRSAENERVVWMWKRAAQTYRGKDLAKTAISYLRMDVVCQSHLDIRTSKRTMQLTIECQNRNSNHYAGEASHNEDDKDQYSFVAIIQCVYT